MKLNLPKKWLKRIVDDKNTNSINNIDKYKNLLPCAYCDGKGKMNVEFSFAQGLNLYSSTCAKDCNPKAVTFGVKDRVCAVELWNSIYTNVKRGTTGD